MKPPPLVAPTPQPASGPGNRSPGKSWRDSDLLHGFLGFLVAGVILAVPVALVFLFVMIAKEDYENAVKVEVEHLKSGNAVVRANAIMELASLERQEAKRAVPAVPYLIANLPDETPLQWNVVHGGGLVPGGEVAIPTKDVTTPGKEAAKTLVAIGPPAIPQLIEAMAGRLDLREAPELVAGQNPLVRGKVASLVTDVLVQIGQPAVEPLTKALDDQRWGVRAGAAEALGKLGDKNAIPALTAKLTDPKAPVREAAAEALGRLGAAPPAAPDKQEPR